jgi:hypothetical protein
VVWGVVSYVLSIAAGSEFTLSLFITSVVINAIPGIILHIVLIPLVIIFLQRAKLMKLSA